MPNNRHFDSFNHVDFSPESHTGAQLPGLIELANEVPLTHCAKDLSCSKSKRGQVTAPEAFYLSDSRTLHCSDLSARGVFCTSDRIDQPFQRSADEVKAIWINESSDMSNKGSQPNFRIAPDGTIKEIRDPHRKMTDFDPLISIEVMNGQAREGQEGNEYTEKQKAALRQLISYVQSNWSENLQLESEMHDPKSRIMSAVFVEPDTEGRNLNGERGWPMLPKPEARRHFWDKPSLFEANEGRKCGEYDRVDQMDEEHKSRFIDQVKKLISRNEGGYNTIALNDNGYGISVGIAQWNQKKGELPKLLRAWYDASEAEQEGQLPELYKSWRQAAEANLQESPKALSETNDSPNRFERIFGRHAQTLLDEKQVREYHFTDGSAESNDMMDRLRTALDDKLFRHVQDELVRNNVRRAILLADKYSHHSTRFIAQVADVANQYGWGGCESILRKANVANIPEDVDGECMAIQAFIDNTPPKTNTKTGEPIYRTERDKRLDKEFPPKNASGLRLMTKYVL